MEKYSKTKILIIEDELITAKSIEQSLLGFGFQSIEIASNYGEGYDKVTNMLPGLILMDIKLEQGQKGHNNHQDGIALSERIQVEFDVPIIYLTAHADSQTVLRAYQTRSYGYVVKPYTDYDLHDAISRALNRFHLSKN